MNLTFLAWTFVGSGAAALGLRLLLNQRTRPMLALALVGVRTVAALVLAALTATVLLVAADQVGPGEGEDVALLLVVALAVVASLAHVDQRGRRLLSELPHTPTAG